MIVLFIIGAALAAAVAGAFLGRWLVWRDSGQWNHDVREALDNAAASAGRANLASAKIEAADLPSVLEHVDRLHRATQETRQKATAAEAQAAEATARVAELEQLVASNFGLTTLRR